MSAISSNYANYSSDYPALQENRADSKPKGGEYETPETQNADGNEQKPTRYDAPLASGPASGNWTGTPIGGADGGQGTGIVGNMRADNGNGSRLDGEFVSNDGKALKFSFFDPAQGEIAVTLHENSVSMTVGVKTDMPMPHVLSFAEADKWTKDESALLDSLSAAFNNVDFSELDPAMHALGELGKQRMEALTDPAFWKRVDQRQAMVEENVHTLANGDKAIIEPEHDRVLEPHYTSRGGVSYTHTDPNNGYKTQGIHVTEDGTQVTFGSHKGDLNPIRYDEDGNVRVALKHQVVTDQQLRSDAITAEMATYTVGAGLQALPIERLGGSARLSSIEPVSDGSAILRFNREGGATDMVELGVTSMKFTTMVKEGAIPGISGEPNAQGMIAITNTLNYSQINEWKNSDRALFEDVKAVMDGTDVENLETAAEKLAFKQANTRLRALEDPGFWASINSQIAGQVNGEIGGEPVVIAEEFPMTTVVTQNQQGERESTLYVDRGNGREKVEIVNDDTVSIGEHEYAVRQDQRNGDWYLVNKHETVDQITTRVIGQHMKVRSAAVEAPDTMSVLNQLSRVPHPSQYGPQDY